MASTYAIEDSHALFTLPQPSHVPAGRILAGPSYSILNSRKRKRSELVIGVDGESIQVYGIKSSQVLTTHAIPPQEYLIAPPLCVHARDSASSERTRCTYFAARNELRNSKYQLECFREKLPRSARDGAISSISPSKHSKNLGFKDESVVLLEAVPNAQSPNSYNIIVVQEHGQISAHSPDLSQEEWKVALEDLLQGVEGSSAGKGSGRRVVQGFCMSAMESKVGLLKGREDLIASFTPTGQISEEVLEQTAVLCLITPTLNDDGAKDTELYELTVLAIQSRPSGLSRSPIRFLVKWQLPNATSTDQDGQREHHQFAYNKAAGTLHLLNSGCLNTYTFSALGPKLFSKLELPHISIDSFIPLPQDLAFTSTKTHYHLQNLRYSSIQASASVTTDATQSSSRKRKRANNKGIANTAPARLLDYFPTEGLVVGVTGNSLVGFPVRLPASQRGHNQAKRSRLLDSLGRGIQLPSTTKVQTAPQLTTASAIASLALADPSLTKVSHHLIDHKPIDLSGAIEATKYLLRSFNAPRPTPLPQSHLLTNGTTHPSDSTAKSATTAPLTSKVAAEDENATIAEDPAETALALEDALTTADLLLATSLLSPTSLPIRGQALKIVLALLGTTFASQQVARAMREHMNRRDILFLIELLRVDLEQGGWTSHSLDVWPEEEEGDGDDGGGEDGVPAARREQAKDKAQDAAVAVVARVLTFAVDALGMGGWLSSSVEDEAVSDADEDAEDDAMSLDDAIHPTRNGISSETSIATLRAETALVLECTQESAFFANFLAEFLRYEEAVVAAHGKGKGSGKVQDPEKVNAPILPLGVRSARGVEAVKVGKGNGEVRARSRREVGHELRKRVGRYTFERLRV